MSKPKYPRCETRKLKDLKAHPDGVRRAEAGEIYRLGQSVNYFGFLRPLTLNIATNTILDGDKVLAALRGRFDPEFEVPVWVVELKEEEEDCAHLALNNHVGVWKWQQVSDQLKEIKARGQDLILTGFHDWDTGPLIAAEWSPPAKGNLSGEPGEVQTGLF